MTSQILSDSNGSGKLKWTFSDADDDFDFLAKNQTLTLTYDIKVSDNHGGIVMQTVKITVTGTDDKPVINMTAVATVTEQANQTLSLSPDTAHVALNFTDADLTNTGHTATVHRRLGDRQHRRILPGSLGTAELMSFFHVDNVVKNSGSSTGTINTTFSAPDLAFDYLAAGEQLDITYTVQLDDHAGGICTQNVMVTVVGTNDKPIYLCGPESAHLVEGQNVNPSGNLTAAWRSAVHRYRPVRHAHGLDHGHGDRVPAAARSRSPMPQLLAAFSHLAGSGFHRPPARRGRLEFRAARTTRRVSSAAARR